MNLSIIAPLLFAAFSAAGNALFALGQKRAEIAENPFVFLVLALITCVFLFSASLPFLPRTNTINYLSKNYPWILISGIGFYVTFIGFYFLYTRYGASFYVLYAVLSIISTSIVVGVLFFKENFNLYHSLSIVLAIATVVLFAIGQSVAQSG